MIMNIEIIWWKWYWIMCINDNEWIMKMTIIMNNE
jgi:hypothetical protein